MTRAERRTRARAANRARRATPHTPGALAWNEQHADNPNRAKRSASPMGWNERTIHPATIRQTPAALIVATPLRTPTGRHATRAGEPLYSRYTIGSRLPQPIVRES